MSIEPTDEVRSGWKDWNTLAVDRGEHRSAYDDLPSCVPLTLCSVGSRSEPVPFHAKSRQAVINGLKT